MLLSMTGFGEAHGQQDGLTVAVEVRTINNRFLKLSVRTSEGCASLEPRIEQIVRKCVRRGTVQVNIRVDRARGADDYRINSDVLNQYRQQLQAIEGPWQAAGDVSIESLLALPGVVDENHSPTVDPEETWDAVRTTLEQALENLSEMRAKEGQAMQADLAANCGVIAESLESVRQRAPQVVEAYRERLEERLKRTLAEYEVTLDPASIIREVSLFADRADISEEVVRLDSHLQQFDAIMQLADSQGRKLEFVSQEMLRETNTIGSKASDVEIARDVIEIKTALERIREMIQNVE